MESIAKQNIYEDILKGTIQKKINKAVEEASLLMEEEDLNIFQASNHITFFTTISKEEAVKRIFEYRKKGFKHFQEVSK